MFKHDDLLTAETAARLIGGDERPLKVSTLANWRVLNRGPKFIKTGRLVRYRYGDILRYLDGRTFETLESVEQAKAVSESVQ